MKKDKLKEIRKEIDKIDKNIIALYQKRKKKIQEIAKYKAKIGKPILDKKREQEIYKKIDSLVKDKENKKELKEIYKKIINLSKISQNRYIGRRKNGR